MNDGPVRRLRPLNALSSARSRRATPLAVLALACTLVLACDRGPEAELHVVVSTLARSEAGQDALRGLRLALEEAGGQARGLPVRLEVYDTLEMSSEQPLSVELELMVARQAVDDPQVVAYLGPMASHQAKVSMPLLNRASIAQVNTTATWPGLTRAGFSEGEPEVYYPSGKRHFFRVVTPDDVQAAAAARWADELGFRAVYVIDNASDYGRGLSEIFYQASLELELEVLGRSSTLVSEDPSYAENLPSILADLNPDLVYYAGGTEQGALDLLRNIRLRLPEIAFLGTEGVLHPKVIESLGSETAEGFYATHVAIPIDQLETSAAKRFRRSFRARYGADPPPEAASAYEAMRAVLTAIETSAEPTREGVLEAMSSAQKIPGLAGFWSFDERGDRAPHWVSGYRVENGQWVFQRTLR